jgi:hypothetical protein
MKTNHVLFVADALTSHQAGQGRISDAEMHRRLDLLNTEQRQAIATAIEAFQLTLERVDTHLAKVTL